MSATTGSTAEGLLAAETSPAPRGGPTPAVIRGLRVARGPAVAMLGQARRRLTGLMTVSSLVRMGADALIVSCAVLIAQLGRLVYGEVFAVAEVPPDLMAEFWLSGLRSLVVILPAALIVFSWSGFYTHGRAYRSRYKLLIVSQAVAIAFLLVAAIGYLFPALVSLPRSALLIGGLISWAALVLARLWSTVWRSELASEKAFSVSPQARSTQGMVLVIGGAGYIGSALLPKLLAHGYRVRILDLMMYGREPIAGFLTHPSCELVQADFRHVDAVVRATRGCDALVHLGGLVGDPACALDEALTIDINLAATRLVAEVAKGAGVRKFIFASTCSVYGAGDAILDERSRLNPHSLYARTKIESERVLLEMADERFRPIILRFATIYGISGRTRFDLVVNLLVAKALIDGEITVFGGDQWRPFLHVEDAGRAIALLMEHELPEPEHPFIFNVGSNAENYTIRQIGEMVHAQVPGARLVQHDGDGDRRNYRVGFDKIHRATGFRPRWTVEGGIRQVATLVAGGGVVDYRHPAYSNATFLRERGSAQLERPRAQWAEELIRQAALSAGLTATSALNAPPSA